MSITRQNLSVIIVSYKSENVIENCINSIDPEIEIIVIDNSNNDELKKKIEAKYKNVRCILSKENLGMGAGNNLGLKHSTTDFVLILNPDVVLENNTIDELIIASKEIESFAVIAPIIKSGININYKLFDENKNNENSINPFKVKSVDGFAMLLNVKKINQINNFKNFKFFDENIFLYLENDDFCKRLVDHNEEIYVVPKSKINHLGGKAVSQKFSEEVELSRNWHWIWSKFYFNRKHKGYFFALINGLPTFISAVLKYVLYLAIFNPKKKKIYLHRAMGYLNAVIGRKSFFRPNIKI
jgi:GT2 family glycosyltransferase